jgi:hypothetical protein
MKRTTLASALCAAICFATAAQASDTSPKPEAVNAGARVTPISYFGVTTCHPLVMWHVSAPLCAPFLGSS